MRVRLLAIVLVLAAVAATLWAAEEPLIGTWKLNLAKSKFTPGPPPRSQTLQYEPSGANGIQRANDEVNAKGERTQSVVTYVFDGKEHPVTGSPLVDAVVNRRMDAYTTERVQKKGGKIVNTLRRIVSKDGKTLTITEEGTDDQGKPFSEITIYDKQ